MCLIYVAHRVDARYRVVVAANRDEFHQRPATPAGWWDDEPGILAGRDLQAGGTWLGMTRGGRFAAVTNYREPQLDKGPLESRGWLVSNFLRAAVAPRSYVLDVSQRRNSYGGFNLIAGATDGLYYCSNRAPDAHPLERGIHGLSNGLLDIPWPKVERGKRMLRAALQETVVQTEIAPGTPLAEEIGQIVETLAAREAHRARVDALERRDVSRSQTTLGRAERHANVLDAFRLRSDAPDLRGRPVVLIDDVITTGATAAEACETLARGGSDGATVVAFARSLPLRRREAA